jgi:hypothetical protein
VSAVGTQIKSLWDDGQIYSRRDSAYRSWT